MNKIYIFTKTLFKIFLYFIELLGVTYFFTYLSSFLLPYDSTFDFIERMIEFYVVYQVLVAVILGNLNDIKADSSLRYKTIIKKCIEYCDCKDERIKEQILKDIDKQLDIGTFNDIKYRDCYTKLKNNIDNLSKTCLKMELINAEHTFEYYSLKWKYSFILRIVK